MGERAGPLENHSQPPALPFQNAAPDALVWCGVKRPWLEPGPFALFCCLVFVVTRRERIVAEAVTIPNLPVGPVDE